ncbi:MAG: hypothetical protein WKF37_24310 [Bryobacteraceae bacterium]
MRIAHNQYHFGLYGGVEARFLDPKFVHRRDQVNEYWPEPVVLNSRLKPVDALDKVTLHPEREHRQDQAPSRKAGRRSLTGTMRFVHLARDRWKVEQGVQQL